MGGLVPFGQDPNTVPARLPTLAVAERMTALLDGPLHHGSPRQLAAIQLGVNIRLAAIVTQHRTFDPALGVAARMQAVSLGGRLHKLADDVCEKLRLA